MNVAAIPFEIHITVGELSALQSTSFREICREENGKPLFMELSRGEFQQQPMFSKVIQEKDLAAAVRLSEHYTSKLRQAGFVPKRLKIEVPFDSMVLFDEGIAVSEKRYYEWHGKVSYERVEQLLKLCEAHNVHVSHNALKDEQNLRFITLREYGAADEFERRVKALNETLQEEGWVVSKQHFEYCLLDTNISLDKGWLIS